MTQSEWVHIAKRFAIATMKLTAQLNKADKDGGYMKRVVTEYTNNLAERLRAWEKEVDSDRSIPSLVDMATPLVKDANKGELTENIAARILQEKIVDESNRNWEARATPSTVWDWTRKRKPLTEQLLSIDRWTPANQHVGDLEKENMFWQWQQAKTQQAADAPAGRMRKRKHFTPGDPIFPLGETVEQEMAMSWRIDQQLSGRT